MAVYVVRRLPQAIPLLVGLSFAGFVLLRLAPGAPMAVYAQNPSMSGSRSRSCCSSSGARSASR